MRYNLQLDVFEYEDICKRSSVACEALDRIDEMEDFFRGKIKQSFYQVSEYMEDLDNTRYRIVTREKIAMGEACKIYPKE